jgi:hypothetical protein
MNRRMTAHQCGATTCKSVNGAAPKLTIIPASPNIEIKLIRKQPPNPYIALTSRISINEIKFFPPFIVPLFPALGVSG